MREIRVDRSVLPRMARTPEGYLRGMAVVTRAGVFEYANSDGTIRKELRHPEDVLHVDSLSSLRMIPVTVDHPGKLVTAENARELAVGFTGETTQVDGQDVLVSLTITHKDGIEAINKGKQELSLGYTLDLVQEDGVFDGVPYTHRQKNVSYNHLAVVDVARAGRAARLNLDGASVQIVEIDPEDRMIKVNIDGIQYDAAPEVGRYIDKLNADLTKARSDAETAEARADEAESKKSEAEIRLDEAEQSIDDRVKARIDLLARANRLVKLDATDYTISSRDVMIKAIKAHRKDVNFDGKSDDYVSARFDAVFEDAADKTPSQTGSHPLAPRLRGDAAEIRTDAEAEHESWKKSVANLNAGRAKATA